MTSRETFQKSECVIMQQTIQIYELISFSSKNKKSAKKKVNSPVQFMLKVKIIVKLKKCPYKMGKLEMSFKLSRIKEKI